MITETFERKVNTSKIECSWCYGVPAQWKITDQLGWTDYVCTVHGSEWFPSAFPESDTTKIECIVGEINSRVSLVKIADHDGHAPEWILADRRVNAKGLHKWPWYPIVGHREGLRANDPVTLASALFILALEGGTAHLSPASVPQSN